MNDREAAIEEAARYLRLALPLEASEAASQAISRSPEVKSLESAAAGKEFAAGNNRDPVLAMPGLIMANSQDRASLELLEKL